MPSWLLFVCIGLLGGISSGIFGIGGGVLVMPALVYWAGFSQHMATGTSLAILLPPIGLAAAYEFYRHGQVDIRAAAIIAVMMFVGSWLGALVANRLSGPSLRLVFGLFVSALGLYIVYDAVRRLDWF